MLRITNSVLAFLLSAHQIQLRTEVIAQVNLYANEAFVYLEDDIEITSKLKINAGVHASAFFVEGKTYHSIQPRISGRYRITDQVSLKASYATMTQFVHLLTNAGIGLPTDLWVPTTSRIKPQYSRQYAFGAAGTFSDLEVSVEGYYKDMHNVIEYKDGATYLGTSQNWQDKVEVGQGNSYGAEFFVQKKIGQFNGWVGYTLSWTNRQFDNLNHGEWFPYRYDRRHDLKVAGTWHVTKRFELGGTWVFSSGQAVTLPLLTYPGAIQDRPYSNDSGFSPNLAGFPINYNAERNNFRMRNYHRMDASATYTIEKKKISHEFNLSIYNLYNRKNPYYLQFGYNHTPSQDIKVLKQVSLIGLVPSLSIQSTLNETFDPYFDSGWLVDVSTMQRTRHR
ncbi:MAG: TonB-dependent receptor [Bacteroidota bacterium]